MKNTARAAVLITALIVLAGCNMAGLGGDDPTPTEEPEEEAAGVPAVIINTPPSGSPASVGDPLFVQSTATDSEGVTRLDLLVNGVLVRSDSTPEGDPQTQFSLLQAWTPDQVGQFTVSVVAFRGDGTASDPASITVNVGEAAASEEAEPEVMCTVTASTQLNVRQGPGAGYGVLGALMLGQQAQVTGKYPDGSWWQISYNSAPGWVSAPYTYSAGDCDLVEIVQLPFLGAGGGPAGSAGAAGVTPTYTPGGPTLTPTYTPGGPTLTPTHTYIPLTPTYTLAGPTMTPAHTQVGPTLTPTHTHTPGGPPPSATWTSTPPLPIAPPDGNYSLVIPLDSTASVTDFVSYPDGDTEDRVNYDVSGMNPNAVLSGGQASLVITASCFGSGTAYIQFSTGGQTFGCGQTIVNRNITYDNRTGSIVITAVGSGPGGATYVQWVLTGTATRTN